MHISRYLVRGLLAAGLVTASGFAGLVPAEAAPSLPTIGCDSSPSVFNTGVDAALTGTVPESEPDRNWETSQQYPATDPRTATPYPPLGPVWSSAIVGNAAPGAWVASPYGNAEWIGGTHTTDGDWYYRYRFNLDPAVATSSLSLSLDFFADNSVQEIWVNGVAQSSQTTGLPQDTTDPYQYGGYSWGSGASTVLSHNWAVGANEIVVLIKSGPGAQGFDVQARPSMLCPQPGATTTQTTDRTVVSAAGDTVTFSAVMSNSGNVALSGVSMAPTDFNGTGPLQYTCPSTDLGVGDSQTCTAVYTVTEADLAVGALQATVVGSGVGQGLEATTTCAPVTSTVTVFRPTVAISGGATVLTRVSPTSIAGTTNVAPGSAVRVTVGGEVLTATVTDARTWSVTPTGLTEGTHQISVGVTDLATGALATATQQLTIDTTAPTVGVDRGPVDRVRTSTPTLTGTYSAPDGTAVSVSVGALTYPATLLNGLWTLTLPTTVDGEYPVTATVTDAAGNTGTASQTLVIDTVAPALVITGGPAAVTRSATPTVGGTSDAAVGTPVTVRIGTRTYLAEVRPDQSWSVTVPPGDRLTDGPNVVTADVTDAAGNTTTAGQVLTVDTVAPTVTITGGPTALTSDKTPTITGTSSEPAGTAITVTVTTAATTLTLPAVVDATGAWSATPVTDLADARYTVTATVTDPAGNPANATQMLTVDTTPPAVTIIGGPATTVASATPTVSGTSDAAPGTTVSVTVDQQRLSTTVRADGTWSVPVGEALSDGVHAVTATVSDPALNVGTAAQALTVDTQKPTLTLDATTVYVSTPTFTGSSDAEPGSVVTVTIGGEVMTTAVLADGSWSVGGVAGLLDGRYDVVVSVRDRAGNTTTARKAVTVDTSPPTVDIDGGPAATSTGSSTVVSGTTDAAPGALVTVVVGGVSWTTTVDADGEWALPAMMLPPGDYDVVVSVSDDAGNVGTRQQTLTVLPSSADDGGTGYDDDPSYDDAPFYDDSFYDGSFYDGSFYDDSVYDGSFYDGSFYDPADLAAAGDGSAYPNADLAYTGTDPGASIIAGLTLLGVGGGLVAATRRRRNTRGV